MTIKLQANDWKLKVSVQKEIPERISSLLFQWSNPLFAAYQSKKTAFFIYSWSFELCLEFSRTEPKFCFEIPADCRITFDFIPGNVLFMLKSRANSLSHFVRREISFDIKRETHNYPPLILASYSIKQLSKVNG